MGRLKKLKINIYLHTSVQGSKACNRISNQAQFAIPASNSKAIIAHSYSEEISVIFVTSLENVPMLETYY
jgi:hypothetical protein